MSDAGYLEFGAEDLQRFLAELDSELLRIDTEFTHLVVVGSAILLKRIPGRATGDIDVVSETLTPAVRSAAI